MSAWNRLIDECGESNAQELWRHLSERPDQPPLLGTVTPMKGRKHAATSDGMSRVYHYEVSGAARVDYRHNATYKTSANGDEHKVVQIVSIALGSH